MEEDKRTFYEWNDSGDFDFVVFDPDGFPRHNVHAMQNDVYTREEFIERAQSSTVLPKSERRSRS